MQPGLLKNLGHLQRVEPNSIWVNERAFSSWLQGNIQLLGECVGLEIDLVQTEVPVGDFACDLVGQESATKRPVVIENQFGRTDHDHLGKLLTYASGHDAGTLIWIATQFRDEHRQSLEWLNNVSQEGIYFFGIELDPIQIDDSPPAVHFNVVVGPPAVKPIAVVGDVSPRRQAYREFFLSFLEELKARHPGLTNASKAGYDSWLGFSAGRTGFGISVAFAQGNRFRVELYIDTGERLSTKAAFDSLLEKREEIERDIGCSLEWERLEQARASRIAAYWPKSISILETEKLPEARNWAVDLFAKFKAVFGPAVSQLTIE